MVEFNPLTYAVDSLRGVFLNFHQFDPRLGPAILLVMAAGAFAVALWEFQRD
jgi:ABC-2 type transport system permease protein